METQFLINQIKIANNKSIVLTSKKEKNIFLRLKDKSKPFNNNCLM
jgi:hypothetical protein